MQPFENLLSPCRGAVERFIRFRIGDSADAEDVLQEVYLTAYQKFHQLQKETAFKPWLLRIARNKCNDYFRRKAEILEIPLESVPEKDLSQSRMGITAVSAATASGVTALRPNVAFSA